MNARPRLRFCGRVAIALGCWFVTAIAHRKVSDAVGEPVSTPFGAFTPIRFTDHAIALAAMALAALLAWRARAGDARAPTLALWVLLTAVAVVAHLTMVTIDIEAIHYPQYALVAVLLAWALDRRGRRRWLLEVVLISTALSVLDEALQYFHLMRRATYFDFNDLVLNQAGTLAGLLWYYGFPRDDRPAGAGKRRLLTGLFVATGLCAVAVGVLAFTGALAIAPAAAIGQEDTLRFAGGLRVVLQWTPGIYDNAWPSRSGGTYYVIGPWSWLACLVAGTAAVWAIERRLRRAGPGWTDGGTATRGNGRSE